MRRTRAGADRRPALPRASASAIARPLGSRCPSVGSTRRRARRRAPSPGSRPPRPVRPPRGKPERLAQPVLAPVLEGPLGVHASRRLPSPSSPGRAPSRPRAAGSTRRSTSSGGQRDGGAELPDEAGRVERRAAGQLGALDEHDVAPALGGRGGTRCSRRPRRPRRSPPARARSRRQIVAGRQALTRTRRPVKWKTSIPAPSITTRPHEELAMKHDAARPELANRPASRPHRRGRARRRRRPPGRAAAQARKGEIVAGLSERMLTLDPANHYSISATSVLRHIYDPLIEVTNDSKFVPCLRSRGRREQHDVAVQPPEGRQVPRRHAVHGGQRHLLAEARAGQHEAHQGLRLPGHRGRAEGRRLHRHRDDEAPFGSLPAHLTMLGCCPRRPPNEDAFFQKPVGTGPFKFGGWTHGEQITLVANATTGSRASRRSRR